MKHSWQLVAPYIGPEWNLHAFMDSLGPIPSGAHLLIVDNSPTNEARDVAGNNLEVVSHPENLGIAASWNLGLERGADQTLLLSVSCRFSTNAVWWLDVADCTANAYGLDFVSQADDEHAVSWHCKAIGRAAVSEVGYFDENFFPTDCEEVDFERRQNLHRGRERGWKGRANIDARYIGVSYVGASVALKAGCIWPEGRTPSGEGVRQYYARKWGGVQNEETYKLPFGDKPLSYWPSPPRRWEQS